MTHLNLSMNYKKNELNLFSFHNLFLKIAILILTPEKYMV